MKALWLIGVAFLPLGALCAQTGAPPQVPEAESFAPLAYFDANCARCHGPNGSFYGKDFGKNLKDDAALRKIVQEMCEGPGNAPLDAAKLEILTDFHRALRDDKPFLVLVSRRAQELSGEASPDATLTLENGERRVAIEQKENKWKVAIPADFPLKGAKLIARRGEKSSEIALSS